MRERLRELVSDSIGEGSTEGAGGAAGSPPRHDGPIERLLAWSDAGADDAAAMAAGSLVGPYRLIELLGRGGMGSVWRAVRADGSLRREVALKLPHPWLVAPTMRQRFQRERDVLALRSHPNSATLYGAGTSDDGRPFLAMELVPGQPIAVHCEATQASRAARLALMRQVLEAIAAAHARGVVHRDLKPSNLLVGQDGAVRVLDFGIALTLDADDASSEKRLTHLGVALHTPGYAAPKQWRGEGVGPFSDVFAPGVLLYQLLTGEIPPGGAAQLTPIQFSSDQRARLWSWLGLGK